MKRYYSIFWTVLIVVLLIGVNSYCYIFIDTTLQEMIVHSHLIVVGSVKQIKEDTNKDLERYEYITLNITEYIKNTVKSSDDQIIIRSFIGEETPEGFNSLEFCPKFVIGDKVLLFLIKQDNGYYELKNCFRGEFKIVGDTLLGTDYTIERFKKEIFGYLDGSNKSLNIQLPEIHRHLESNTLIKSAKTADIGKHVVNSDTLFTTMNCLGFIPVDYNMEIGLNTAYCYDYTGSPINFGATKTAMDSVVAQWNSVPHSGLNFTVSGVASPYTYNRDDAYSVVSFEDMASGVGGTCFHTWDSSTGAFTVDMKLNSDYRWSVTYNYPPVPDGGWPAGNEPEGTQPLDFWNIAVHELGHGNGLADLVSPSQSTYTMYGNTYRDELQKRDLTNADRAGAVHNCTDPLGEIGFNQFWSAYQKDYSGIYCPDSVRVSGNVTIPSQKMLNVDSGVYVYLNGYYVKTTGGSFLDKGATWNPYIKLSAAGSLKGMFPTFKSAIDNSASGDTLYIGNDVSVASGTSVTINSNTVIAFAENKKLEIYGTLIVGSGVKFTKNTGVNYWSGIDLKSSGTMTVNGDITIEYASCGIDITDGTLSNGSNTVTIQNCSTVGLSVYNCSPTINNVKCQNTGSYYGGLMVGGSYANAILSHNRVESSNHGIYIAVSGNATVDYCDITKSNLDHSVQFTSSGFADLDGNNNINPASGKKAINNENTNTIDAENNWWGTSSPTSILFTFPLKVDYDPAITDSITSAGVYKIVQMDEKPRKMALKMEMMGDYSNAYSAYYDQFTKESEPSWRKFLITSMLRVCDLSSRNYDDIRSVIEKELIIASGDYKGSLEFILCDLLTREEKYYDAINAFKEKVTDYQNTQTAVEMYMRISGIYSDYLKDNDSALKYADIAAALNPGSPALRLTYESIGAIYNPAQFTDIFDGGSIKPAPEPETGVSNDKVFVGVYPNPANPTTTISYSISSTSHVNLSIYNISGQKVVTLVDGPMNAGVYTVKFDGSVYGSGLYFYRLSSNEIRKTGKILILR